MSRSRQALTLGLVACLGAGLGAWAMRLQFDRTLAAWDPAQRLAFRIQQDLGLSAGQTAEVLQVLNRQKSGMEQRRQAWRQEVRILAREGEDKIGRLLDPQQTRRFMALHDQIHGRVDRYLWSSESAPTALATGDTKER